MAYTDVCGRLVHDIISGAQPGLDPAFTRLLDHTFVPPRVKRSPLRIFKAGSMAREQLLAEAYEARREAVDAAIVAAGLLVRRGLAEVELPDGCQWPPFVSEALGAPLYEMSFAEVYAPPDEVAIA